MKTPWWVLPLIVVSQFFCTSLWFAGNAVMPDLIKQFHLQAGFLAALTSAIQFGFIAGTLVFALLGIADRFSPSFVFFISSILAGAFNLSIVAPGMHVSGLLVFRFLTGFFIAGIYPVGIKIASDHYQKGLGRSLGFLVGALVLGTAFPHLLKSITTNLPWKYTFFSTTALAVIGGSCVLLFLPVGRYHKRGQKLNFMAFIKVFHHQKFRAASFGYFGHMWELYTFWAFVPSMLAMYNRHHFGVNLDVPLLSFIIIASGGFACVLGGLFSQRFGAKKLATIALSLSCLCCLVSPLFLYANSAVILISFLLFWGLVVIADSPLFGTLITQNAPEESKGSSITIVTCIGFSITIISIQFINALSDMINAQYIYVFLAIGPLLGLLALFNDKTARADGDMVIKNP